MNNPRIYIAIETFFPLVGGSEKQAFLQGKYLCEQGIQATIITLCHSSTWPASEMMDGVPVLRFAGNMLRWHSTSLLFFRRFVYLLTLLVFTYQLWRRRDEYEVLHVFQFTLFTLPVLFVARFAQKQLIIGMRCECRPRNTDRSDRGQWSDLDSLAQLGQPALRLISQTLNVVQAQITILSPQMRESLARYGFDKVRIHLLPNGIDTEHFSPLASTQIELKKISSVQLINATDEDLTVVCVAKMRYQKGIDVLLRAWSRVVQQVPQARLLLVGNGPELASLQALAQELNLLPQVEFIGLCQDVVSQLHRATVAVLPSRWEGMSNALLEAMACGLPCVATRVSGSEELLGRETSCGVLVEPEDVAGLADALLFLLQDPSLAREYGARARKHVEEYYQLHSTLAASLPLYLSHLADCSG